VAQGGSIAQEQSRATLQINPRAGAAAFPFLIQKPAAVRRGAGSVAVTRWHCRPRLRRLAQAPITRLASPPSPRAAARRRHAPSRYSLAAAPLPPRHIFFVVLPLLLPPPATQEVEVEVEVEGTCRLQLPSPTRKLLRRYSSPPPGQ